MASKKEDITKLDLYDILSVSPDATEKEIVTAYRKTARKCHPDKNPDNPKAAEQFHLISKALEVLTDEAARAAYDKVLRAKKQAQVRHRELDAKRKKLKEDLESRERAAESFSSQNPDISAEERFEREIKRLREEGSALLRDEKARLEKQLREEEEAGQSEAGTCQPARLKLKWKGSAAGAEQYTEASIRKLLCKYGQINALILSAKKKGSAIVEFQDAWSANMAMETEMGFPTCPLTLTWISGKPEPIAVPSQPAFSSYPDASENNTADTTDNNDFEELVLMRMRQAQERKRLIEEMQKDDVIDLS